MTKLRLNLPRELVPDSALNRAWQRFVPELDVSGLISAVIMTATSFVTTHTYQDQQRNYLKQLAFILSLSSVSSITNFCDATICSNYASEVLSSIDGVTLILMNALYQRLAPGWIQVVRERKYYRGELEAKCLLGLFWHSQSQAATCHARAIKLHDKRLKAAVKSQ